MKKKFTYYIHYAGHKRSGYMFLTHDEHFDKFCLNDKVREAYNAVSEELGFGEFKDDFIYAADDVFDYMVEHMGFGLIEVDERLYLLSMLDFNVL